MNQKKTDRRVERTRQLLRDALVALILEKGYQKITVQDIIDRANVGRSTFYSHYQDKEDLLFSGFDELAYDLDLHMRSPEETGDSQEHLLHSLEFFIHANNNRELYMAMSESGGGEQLLEIGRQHMQNHIKAHLVQFPSIGRELPLPVITSFLAGSLLTMIMWWLEQDTPYSPQEMDDMFNALAMPGIRSLMGVDASQE
jgi:AcrR family transcriptional regulator